MHYLECIALLDYLLKKLHAGQRVQVPLSVTDEVRMHVVAINGKLAQETDIQMKAKIRDILEAVTTVKMAKGTTCLTDVMKEALVTGISELKSLVSLQAFEYFKTHDFEPTEPIIPVMRSVVSEALARGLI